MKIFFSIITILFLTTARLIAGGAPSTYFNIYLPPNNDAVQRNVALIVTAIYDETTFTITDDDADGDSDDTVTGTLQAGQSYILYIKDNGINDDAQYASGGVLKRDGDYFIINSSNLVFASMSTDSDWQHDFVPSVNKTSIGEKYIIYAPKISSSKGDLNVFAYENNTTITISKISKTPTTVTGYTNIDLEQKTIIKQRTLNIGQDIIHFYPDGRDVMETGETYMIESNKPVTVQYGALWTNARDGGGYVPSANGSSSGDLFYFAVPYQSAGEQEIRIASWSSGNQVKLDRFENGNWVAMKSWTMDRLKPADWIGKSNGSATYPTVFRITCSSGKKVSVFECNWMETGSPGTSDMASMVSSEAGTDAGKEFLAYLLPPGNQTNVVNPFTGKAFGGNFAHCYLFAGNAAAKVTIKDAKTNGQKINKVYTIAANRYADAFFSLAEWKSIYNGDGNPATGTERPYVLIESDQNISVMNANTNDNWMMYFGSSLESAFKQSGNVNKEIGIPGEMVNFNSVISNGSNTITDPKLVVTVGSGCIASSPMLNTGSGNIKGNVVTTTTNSTITFDGIPNIAPNKDITVSTNLTITPTFNDGKPIPNNTIISVESTITGTINGQIQQSTVSSGLQNQSSNSANLLFNTCYTGELTELLTDSWNHAWIDYNNDGWEDLFVTDRSTSRPNQLFKNNGNGTFTKAYAGALGSLSEKTIASAWGDFNNDGFIDVFVANATGSKSHLYKNNQGSFTEVNNCGLSVNAEYFHGAAWVDFDNDGYLDLIVTNFFETKFHEVYRNNKNGTFTRLLNNPIATESNRSTVPALADYNNDGLVDMFIPNGDNKANSLFKNTGNGNFEKITKGDIVTDLANSVGAAWGDYNNDGWMDLLVLNASNQNNQLYKNKGDGSFERVMDTPIDKDKGNSHSGLWLDIDNDTDLDLLITNDKGVKFLYINDGKGSFSRKLDEYVNSDYGNAMGITAADYNKDGSLDVYVSTHSNQKNKLFCNTSLDNNNFINIKLVGTSSNSSAIGATLKIISDDKLQSRQVLPVQGLGSQNSLRQHFGLGSSKQVSSIEIDWPSGYKQIVNNVPANQFLTITEESGNLVKGFAFEDKNNNCKWDEKEQKIENIRFAVKPLGTNFATLSEGKYELRLNAGSYEVEIQPNDFWKLNCSQKIKVSGNNNTIEHFFPLSAEKKGYDLQVNTGVTAWRRGFANESLLSCSNAGTGPATKVELTISYPDPVDLKWAKIPWTSKSGTSYTWYFDTIAAGKSIQILLRDSVTLSASVGQELTLKANVGAQDDDLDPSNNDYSEEIAIVGAIDPNDILVFPKGAGKEGIIDRNQLLTYTIRFQNVGSYYASRIVLKNWLSKHLDWRTFKIEAVSHPNYNFEITDDGLLSVVFQDINLPDSTVNEPESHGFFKYSILPNKEAFGGAKIENSVAISFDYEDPLQSNTVLNTIQFAATKEASELLIFPIPVLEELNIVGQIQTLSSKINPLLVDLTVYDLQGKAILNFQNADDLIVKRNISGLPPGTYVVSAFDKNGKLFKGKFIKY